MKTVFDFLTDREQPARFSDIQSATGYSDSEAQEAIRALLDSEKIRMVNVLAHFGKGSGNTGYRWFDLGFEVCRPVQNASI